MQDPGYLLREGEFNTQDPLCDVWVEATGNHLFNPDFKNIR